MLLVFFLFHQDVALKVIVLAGATSLLLLVGSIFRSINEGVVDDIPHAAELLIVVKAGIRVTDELG